MDDDDRITICKAIAASCMWGHGGIGSVIIDTLDKRLPLDPSWRQLYTTNEKAAKRESVGVVTDADELERLLKRGYQLTNWNDDGCSLFNPRDCGGGLHKYVDKAVAARWDWR